MNFASKLITCALLATTLSACKSVPQKIALPPEIIHVPQFMPLPADCSVTQSVVLPSGSSAEDVMKALKIAVDNYNKQVERCFKQGTP